MVVLPISTEVVRDTFQSPDQKFMKKISLFRLSLSLYAGAQAADATKEQVLRAKDDLGADVFSEAAARSQATVTKYAQESAAVSIMISPMTVP